jgi:hypothetical protein
MAPQQLPDFKPSRNCRGLNADQGTYCSVALPVKFH